MKNLFFVLIISVVFLTSCQKERTKQVYGYLHYSVKGNVTKTEDANFDHILTKQSEIDNYLNLNKNSLIENPDTNYLKYNKTFIIVTD